jgi:uncharacterized integral membrane protein (TIGR00698 family)
MLDSSVIRRSPVSVLGGPTRQWTAWRVLLPGIALVAAIALASLQLAKLHWLQAHGISALTLSIVLGIALGNTVYPSLAASSSKGVAFSKYWLLRAGIVLYGLRLTFHDIAQVGMVGVLIDALVLTSTFGIAYLVGTRLFKLDTNAVILIGAGSAICGAAAVMATEPVLRGRSEQVCVAVATVVVFGTVGMFLYPALFELNAHHPLVAMTPTGFGIYAGSTIHEVAQVVAAGRSVSEAAANTAVITKMVRVMMLAPFLMALSAYLSRRTSRAAPQESSARGKIVIPWFALGFVAVAAFNSLNWLPGSVVSTAVTLDTVILAMAMAALGLTTQASAIKTAGFKPLGLAAVVFAWLMVGGFLINAGAMRLFAIL